MEDGAGGIRVSLFDRHRPSAQSLARYITGDDSAASSIVNRSFTRCFARLGHLRDPQIFELQLLHDVIQRSRRRAARIGDRPALERIVLHLAVAEQLPATAIAELSGCSETRVRRILEHSEGREVPAELIAPDDDRSGTERRRSRIMVRATALLVIAFLAILTAGTGILLNVIAERPDPQISIPTRVDEQPLPEVLNTRFRPIDEPTVVAKGDAGGHGWVLRTYPAQHGTVCLEIRVDERFGSARCPGAFSSSITTFVAPDGRHSMTYIFGRARRDIEALSLTEKGGRSIELQLHKVPNHPGKEPAQMFVALLPDYLLHLSNEEQGRSLGYRVFELALTASKRGRELESETIYLGRPV